MHRQGSESLLATTSELLQRAARDVKQLSAMQQASPDDRQLKLAVSKLGKSFSDMKIDQDLRAVLARFEKAARSVALSRRHPLAPTTTTDTSVAIDTLTYDDQESDENAPLLAGEMTLLPDNVVEYQDALIAERDADILDIQHSIGQVNEIFRDLGSLVHDQGHMLGIISLLLISRQH